MSGKETANMYRICTSTKTNVAYISFAWDTTSLCSHWKAFRTKPTPPSPAVALSHHFIYLAAHLANCSLFHCYQQILLVIRKKGQLVH
jgi:hypothetical protein